MNSLPGCCDFAVEHRAHQGEGWWCPMSVKVLEFKPINNDKVVGFADVEFTSGTQMLGIVIIRTKDGDLAALPPGKPQIDQSGAVRKKANGKSDYWPSSSLGPGR